MTRQAVEVHIEQKSQIKLYLDRIVDFCHMNDLVVKKLLVVD